MDTRLICTLIGAVLSVSWIFFLFLLTGGQGLMSMGLFEFIVNWICVAGLSFGSFAFSSQMGWFALLGWTGGQFVFLTYDGTPKGSPQMFQPTNFGEAMLYALGIVVGFNWPSILGAIGGYLARRGTARKKS